MRLRGRNRPRTGRDAASSSRAVRRLDHITVKRDRAGGSNPQREQLALDLRRGIHSNRLMGQHHARKAARRAKRRRRLHLPVDVAQAGAAAQAHRRRAGDGEARPDLEVPVVGGGRVRRARQVSVPVSAALDG